jgi:hypothetical protein
MNKVAKRAMTIAHGTNLWDNLLLDENLKLETINKQTMTGLLDTALARLKDRNPCIIEVGSWKGSSAIYMCEKLRGSEFGLICVDTFLGSIEQWKEKDPVDPGSPWTHAKLDCKNGQPRVYQHFLSNMYAWQDYVCPIPIPSLVAARLLEELRGDIDMVYIDGGHSYGEVIEDLRAWYPYLKKDGFLVGDDYGHAPGVVKAIHEFFGELLASGVNCTLNVAPGKFLLELA